MAEASVEGWRPDVLGEHFEQLTLPLGHDDEGELVATLVRYRPRWRLRLTPGAASGTDVLYVHGWSDYFFNPELAEYWSNAGARFYALDLRKYGRSLRAGQTPGYITDLAQYDADIEAALAAMGHGVTDAPASVSPGPARAGGASARPLILLGHSTGGLTLSLWAARHRGRAAALVLNSPWLEFQASRVGREAIAPVIGWGAKVNPLGALPNVDLGFYTRTVAAEQDGEWEYNHHWRPDRGFSTHPAWLTAILAGHATIAAGVDVGVPVLTLLSARSTIQPRWDPAMLVERHRARRRRDRPPGAEARVERGRRSHRRGAPRRVPLAPARPRGGLRRAHPVAAGLRAAPLTLQRLRCEGMSRQRKFTNCRATSRSLPLSSAIVACRSSRLFEETRSSSPWIWLFTLFGASSRMIFEIFFAFSESMPAFIDASMRNSLPDAKGSPASSERSEMPRLMSFAS